MTTCDLCNEEESFRLSIKYSVEHKSVLYHAHKNLTFLDILSKLCELYPALWKQDTLYHFYLDMGGLYQAIEDPRWLRGKTKKTNTNFSPVILC